MTSLKWVALAAVVASAGAFANPPDQSTTRTDQTTTSKTTTSTTTMPEFRSLDTNKDGVVSKEEAGQNIDISGQFDSLDADKNGTLSTSEYAKATGKDHSNSNPSPKSKPSGY